ncbi:MAG TPA: hypothetical protein VGI40_28365 [Pirellulaceae bacterium]|jgi:hypothetical protein
MARVSLVQTTQGPRNFYNVDGTVGPGGLNRRDDVLLVQYFLNAAFDSSVFSDSQPPDGDLDIDGRPGPKTFSAILHFQTVMRKKGHAIATDGRVDPPTGEEIRGSISNTQYTIIYLNLAYAFDRPDDWPAVSEASDCPAELKTLLKEPKFAGEK